MKNWKARITITCVAAVLATILCMSSTPTSLPSPRHAQVQGEGLTQRPPAAVLKPIQPQACKPH